MPDTPSRKAMRYQERVIEAVATAMWEGGCPGGGVHVTSPVDVTVRSGPTPGGVLAVRMRFREDGVDAFLADGGEEVVPTPPGGWPAWVTPAGDAPPDAEARSFACEAEGDIGLFAFLKVVATRARSAMDGPARDGTYPNAMAALGDAAVPAVPAADDDLRPSGAPEEAVAARAEARPSS